MSELFRNTRLALARLTRGHGSFRGRDRFLRAMDRLMRRLDPVPIETDIAGVRFKLDTEDLIDFRLLYLGAHQRDLVDYISARLRSSDSVLWDVGANIGAVSLCLASRSPGMQIHAFEPSPPVFARLVENVQLNPTLKPRVHLHREALSSATGTASFFVSNEPFNSGVGGLGPSQNRDNTPVEVVAIRGDDLIESGRIPPPSLIKIDVEGFELEVLRGLERFLRKNQDVEIVFEHEPYRLCERSLGRRTVIDFLGSLGFEVQQFEDTERGITSPLTESTLDRSCDLVARKLSRGSG